MRKKDVLTTLTLKTEPGFEDSDPVVTTPSKKSSKYKIDYNLNRKNHKECEKSRRDELKTHLHRLREQVQLGQGQDSKKCTKTKTQTCTKLGLLSKAEKCIKILEAKELKHRTLKETLKREQKQLKKQLEELQGITRPPVASHSVTSNSPTMSLTPLSVPHILKRTHISVPSSFNDEQEQLQISEVEVEVISDVPDRAEMCVMFDAVEELHGFETHCEEVITQQEFHDSVQDDGTLISDESAYG